MDDLYVALQRTNDIVESLADVLQSTRTGNTQTVIHKSSFGGIVAGASMALCISTLIVVLYIAKDLRDDLRDAKAWNEVLRGKVAAIEGKLNH